MTRKERKVRNQSEMRNAITEKVAAFERAGKELLEKVECGQGKHLDLETLIPIRRSIFNVQGISHSALALVQRRIDGLEAKAQAALSRWLKEKTGLGKSNEEQE